MEEMMTHTIDNSPKEILDKKKNILTKLKPNEFNSPD